MELNLRLLINVLAVVILVLGYVSNVVPPEFKEYVGLAVAVLNLVLNFLKERVGDAVAKWL